MIPNSAVAKFVQKNLVYISEDQRRRTFKKWIYSDRQPCNAGKANRNSRVNIQSLGSCTDLKYSNMESSLEKITFQKISRNKKALSLSVTFKEPFGETNGVKVIMEKWTNNGWIQVPFIPLLKDVCHLFTIFFKKVWINVIRNLGIKDPNQSCPLPPGHYELTNFTFDEITFPRTLFPLHGLVRTKTVVLDLKDHDKLIYCLEAIVSIEENMESSDS